MLTVGRLACVVAWTSFVVSCSIAGPTIACSGQVAEVTLLFLTFAC